LLDRYLAGDAAMNEADAANLLKSLPDGPPLADGKSKTIRRTTEPGVAMMSFKPHARSITSRREEDVPGSDYWRILATLELMLMLDKAGVDTHLRCRRVLCYQGRLYLVVSEMAPVPIEWIVRYQAAGSIVRLFPALVREGQRFDPPLFKYDYKQDVAVAGVDDPTLNESYIVGLRLLSEEQLRRAKELLGRVGVLVRNRLAVAGMRLVDMKMEFGLGGPVGFLRTVSGRSVVVIDEISQDCIRAVDEATGRSLTKDLFRQLKSPEEVVAAYAEFVRRLNPDFASLIWTID
jgi:phosphoribosylaminoimidazole-succinocarboxamide synthase